MKETMELKETIIKAISHGIMDMSIIDGEQYTPLIFGFVERAKGISERESLCILYYEYCSTFCFPFVKGKKRIDLFINRIRDLYRLDK